MVKLLGTVGLACCGLFIAHVTANSAESEVPEPFRGYDDTSGYTINFDELTDLLNRVVIARGRSTRVFAAPPPEITGTRMKTKITRTANEGNRFFYEAFKDSEEGRQYLLAIQESLVQMPASTPLHKFSRDEQLAYWLNLYNVTVLNEVVAVYPKRSLKKLFRGRNSIFSEKLLTVAGVPLSLDDIQFTILKQNYDGNPLVLYGLYQGIIGGPNIRPSAYYGDDVYRALEENAIEFVNSNRGTFSIDEGSFRVSSFYKRNKAYFPEFDADLSEHLLQYLEGEEINKILAADNLKANINDWTVTDLGGTRHEVGGSFAYNNAALLDSFKSDRQSSTGGILTATLEVKRAKKPRNPLDEPDVTKPYSEAPVEGASVEEIAAE